MKTTLLKDVKHSTPFKFSNLDTNIFYVVEVGDMVKYSDKNGFVRTTSLYTEVYVNGLGRKFNRCKGCCK